MKTIVPLLVLVFTSLRSPADDSTICIGTNTFSLTFADSTLTEGQKRTIVADLQHEYDSLTNRPVVLHDAEDGGYVSFLAYGVAPYDDAVRLPREYSFDGATGIRQIIVGRNLSDKYLESIALIAANNAAYAQGLAFVSTLRTGRLSTMASNDVNQVFYSQKSVPEEAAANSRDELSHYLDGYDLLYPGLLSFCLSSDLISDGTATLAMFIPYVDNGDSGRHDALPAVWTDGRWKLFLGCP